MLYYGRIKWLFGFIIESILLYDKLSLKKLYFVSVEYFTSFVQRLVRIKHSRIIYFLCWLNSFFR